MFEEANHRHLFQKATDDEEKRADHMINVLDNLVFFQCLEAVGLLNI